MKDMQIKITRWHCVTNILAIFKNLTIPSVGENVEQMELPLLHSYWWEYKMVQPLWISVWQSFKS